MEQSREKELNYLKKYLSKTFKDLPIELILTDNFLLYLEIYITCINYDLKVNKEELKNIQIYIINYILQKLGDEVE